MYVEIGPDMFPYMVQSDEAVPKGAIAMNSIQRLCCRVTNGDMLDIPKGGFLQPKTVLSKMTVEVEHAATTKKGGAVSVKDFLQKWMKTFSGQYFGLGLG